jgi:hypothetical protein
MLDFLGFYACCWYKCVWVIVQLIESHTDSVAGDGKANISLLQVTDVYNAN